MKYSTKRAQNKYSLIEKEKDKVIFADFDGTIKHGYISKVNTNAFGELVIQIKKYGANAISMQYYEAEIGQTWFFSCKVYEAMLELQRQIEQEGMDEY